MTIHRQVGHRRAKRCQDPRGLLSRGDGDGHRMDASEIRPTPQQAHDEPPHDEEHDWQAVNHDGNRDIYKCTRCGALTEV